MVEHIVSDLEKFRREHGLTQGELASRLGVSQPHLSRVISGTTPPGNKLAFRIERLLNRPSPKRTDKWLDRVGHAAGRSNAFRTLVDSALEIMKKR
jgi:transcriptional regulator with XRE-family HTH domain